MTINAYKTGHPPFSFFITRSAAVERVNTLPFSNKIKLL